MLDGVSLYKDDDHLSPVGTEQLRPLFLPLFESMQALGSAAADS